MLFAIFATKALQIFAKPTVLAITAVLVADFANLQTSLAVVGNRRSRDDPHVQQPACRDTRCHNMRAIAHAHQ
jgi:hypothetical protein